MLRAGRGSHGDRRGPAGVPLSPEPEAINIDSDRDSDRADHEQFELKRLSADAIGEAMEKMKRYRLLNEPDDAESICRDILRVDPDHKDARVGLLLCLTDQFDQGLAGRMTEAIGIAESLPDPYDRLYYQGIVCERRAKTHFKQHSPQRGCLTHTWLKKAMDWFEQAAACRPASDDAALLRWNTCARMIMGHDEIRAAAEEGPAEPLGMLE